MKVSQEIILRPRFTLSVGKSAETLLNQFKEAHNPKRFITTQVDSHVFIKIPKARQEFWSPQLDLVINQLNENSAEVRGLFGPRSAVWTLFMFMHFIVAMIFIGCAVWGYSNYSLGESFAVPLVIMLLMILTWFVLYFLGRMGRATGKGQMVELHKFMWEVLNKD